ncbi:MAG TPA: hypothetical protein V6C88_15690 [Chroococcidiopsis sp.]
MASPRFRTIALAAVLAAPLAALAAQTALASKDNFVVNNDTRANMVELYLSPSNRNSWDSNVLSGVLRSGQSTRVSFSDPSPQVCLYDIMAVFADGRQVQDYQINVCANADYTFYN